MKKPSQPVPENVQRFVDTFSGGLDLALFYLKWIEKGLNAQEAYLALHPTVDRHSAATLGSRLLKKVDRQAVLEAYGLDLQLYFQQLRDALGAKKWNDFTGEYVDDHTTRKPYHDKLGRLLEIEQDGPGVAVQVNTLSLSDEQLKRVLGD